MSCNTCGGAKSSLTYTPISGSVVTGSIQPARYTPSVIGRGIIGLTKSFLGADVTPPELKAERRDICSNCPHSTKHKNSQEQRATNAHGQELKKNS